MAINVHYQPPMEMISQAAYRAGLGQFNQRQQQIALQQQEAEANRMMRERQLALQANAQQFEMQRAVQNDMLRRAQVEQGFLDQQRQFELADMRQRAYMQQVQQNDPQVRAAAEWQRDAVQMIEKDVNSLQGSMSSMNLNEEGQKRRAALMGQLRSIQSKRHSMRQEAYQDAIGQWMNDVTSSSLEDYAVEPPTAESVAATNMKKIDDYNALIIDSDGNPKVVRLQPPPKATGGTAIIDETTNAPLPFEQFVRQNYDTYVKMRDAARKELIEEAKLTQGDALTVTPPTAAQIMARVRQNYQDDVSAMTPREPAPMIDPAAVLRQNERPQQMPATAQAAKNPSNTQPTKRWRVLPDGTMQEVK